MASTSELACIYRAFILHSDKVTVTALANIDSNSLICNVGAGDSAPAAVAAVSTAAPVAAEEKKEEKKLEESEESDDDMGFGLFD
ncbi:60S acidic ribosomal protein P1-like isoform X2 [Carcharodon carcharias]|uniref:60S acidic ribosomal protein P1-like isoform X2 n=1 Tax=Carcharodon carcharias TaxID=13397 RepID=UPI001B7EF212|nr:60S acidic ribosomal protein P1-like isoform X2 [Carcharodon carcharias]